MDQLSNHHRDISYVIHLLLGLLTAGLVAFGLSIDRWFTRLADVYAPFHRWHAGYSLGTLIPIGLTIASLFMVSRLVYQSSVGRFFSEHSHTALTAIGWLCGLASVIFGLTALHALLTGAFGLGIGAGLPLLALIASGIFGLLTVIPAFVIRHHLTRQLEEGHFDRHGYPTHAHAHEYASYGHEYPTYGHEYADYGHGYRAY